MGHNLYVETTGDAGGHAIYRFAPTVWAPGAGGGGGGAAVATSAHAGTTAGIVILCLLAIANLYVLVLVAKASSLTILPCLGGGAQASQKYTSAGFFVPAAAAGAGGDYTAPAGLSA